MAEEKAEFFDRLTALIGDLRSLPGAPPAQLEHARIGVARAIATGQKESITREKAVAPVIGSHALSAEHRASFESIIDSVTAEPTPRPEFICRINSKNALTFVINKNNLQPLLNRRLTPEPLLPQHTRRI